MVFYGNQMACTLVISLTDQSGKPQPALIGDAILNEFHMRDLTLSCACCRVDLGAPIDLSAINRNVNSPIEWTTSAHRFGVDLVLDLENLS